MNEIYIKGQCENCGFCFKGNHRLIEGAFAPLSCPSCGKETHNFDEAGEVDIRNTGEETVPEYVESVFK